MRIKGISLRGFGRFSDLTLDGLGGRFNLICGPNEAGKTTLQLGILSLLYGMKKPAKERAYYETVHERMEPWGGGPYEASMTLEADGREFEVHRCFNKAKEWVRIFSLPTGREITGEFHEDRTRERDFAFRHLNLTKRQFRDICMIGQLPKGINPDTGDRAEWEKPEEVAEKLTGMLEAASDEFSPSRAIQVIDKLLREEIGSEDAYTRPLRQHMDKLAELASERERILAKRQELADAEKRIREGEGALKDLEERRGRLERILNVHELSSIEKRLSDLAGLEEEERGISGEIAGLSAYKGFPSERRDELLSKAGRLEEREKEREERSAELDEETARWKEGEGKLQEMSALLGVEMNPDGMLQSAESLYQGTKGEELMELREREIEREAAGLRRLRAKGKLLSVAALLSAAAAAAAFILVPHTIWRVGGTCVLAVLSLALSLTVRKVRRRVRLDEERIGRGRDRLRAERGRMEETTSLLRGVIGAAGFGDYPKLRAFLEGKREEKRKVRDLRESLVRTDDSIRQLRREVDDLLKAAGVASVVSFQEGCESRARYEERSHRLRQLEKERNIILNGSRREGLEKRRDDLREEIGEGDTRPSESALLPDEARSEVEEVDREIGEWRDEVSRCGGILEAGLRGYRPLALVEEEMEGCRDRLDYLRFHRAALERAREVMEEVSSDYQVRFVPRLDAACGEIFGSITSRYAEVGVEKDLTLNVKVPEVNQFKSVAYLSKGTLDQAYLALRLSVVRLLAGDGERPPLLLDDPLASYDPDRLVQTLRFLVDFSAEFQIIYLTCHPHHTEIMKGIASERGLTCDERRVEDLAIVSID